MRAGEAALTQHSIAAALVACRRTSDWQRAQAIFDGARSTAAAADMCTDALFDALADAGEYKKLLEYFDALHKARTPGKKAFTHAIEACDRTADPERSLVLFAEMKASGV